MWTFCDDGLWMSLTPFLFPVLPYSSCPATCFWFLRGAVRCISSRQGNLLIEVVHCQHCSIPWLNEWRSSLPNMLYFAFFLECLVSTWFRVSARTVWSTSVQENSEILNRVLPSHCVCWSGHSTLLDSMGDEHKHSSLNPQIPSLLDSYFEISSHKVVLFRLCIT